MWVVRDFTLQLVDQEGDPINAKEYNDLEIKKLILNKPEVVL